MNSMGWIKLHRKLQFSDMFQSLTAKQRDVMIQLIFLANHEPHEWEWKGKVFKVKRGQCITSLDSIKKLCANDVSLKNIRTALVKLEKWQFLANESAKTGRLVTILNYDRYQDKEEPSGKANGKQAAKDRQTGGKQAATNKNNKEGLKNDKEYRANQFIEKVFDYDLTYSKELMEKFISYWTESGENDIKLRFEKEKTFNVKARLTRFKMNEKNWNNGQTAKRDYKTGSVATYEEHMQEKLSDF